MRKVVTYRYENPRGEDLYYAEIVHDGLKVRATFGTTNTSKGTSRVFERTGDRYETVEAAEKAVTRILEGRAKSYANKQRTEDLVPAGDTSLAAGASNPALESEVLASRDNPGPATVYADWLQTQGDLRGELASLFLAGKTAEAQAWIAKHAPRIFGDLDVKLDSELYNLVWTHGFLTGASLKRSNIDSRTKLDAITREFLALPIARFVTSLRFGLSGYENDNDWGDTMVAITSSPQAAQLRSLRFDDYESEDCEISWTGFGDFSSAWASLPVLEELRIRSGEGGTLGAIELPNLRKFVRVSGGLGSEEISSIMAARWPRLEHLEIWFGSEDYGATGNADSLKTLLEGNAPTTLTHLGVVNAAFTHELIEPLVKSVLLPRLKSLDLSKGVLQDGDAEHLIANAKAFRHLTRLDLSENLLEEQLHAIRAALPNAVVDGQRDAEDDRYVALGE